MIVEHPHESNEQSPLPFTGDNTNEVQNRWSWTGFFPYTSSDGKTERGKTLWDWMNLLIIPLLLAGGLAVFNQILHANEVEATNDAARETAFENYVGRMQELLIADKLGQADTPAEVTVVAQTMTSTVFRRLDIERKIGVLDLLYNAELLQIDHPVISLRAVDLSNAHIAEFYLPGADVAYVNLSYAQLREAFLVGSGLEWADLSHADLYSANLKDSKLLFTDFTQAILTYADLSNADLNGAILVDTNLVAAQLSEANLAGAKLNRADLTNAYLGRANMYGADLSDAHLLGANLAAANLTGATVTEAQLASASTLARATLPDGTVHP